jgi:hypothetical protein
MRRAHAGAETPDRPNHYKELGLRCDCDADEVKLKTNRAVALARKSAL